MSSMTQSPPRTSLTSIPTDCPQDTQKIQHLRFLPSGNALLSGTCDSLRVLVWDPTPCVVANVTHAHHTVSVLESCSSVAWLVCACLLQLDAPWGRLADMQLCNDTKLVSASLDGTYVREWGVDVKVGARPATVPHTGANLLTTCTVTNLRRKLCHSCMEMATRMLSLQRWLLIDPLVPLQDRDRRAARRRSELVSHARPAGIMCTVSIPTRHHLQRRRRVPKPPMGAMAGHTQAAATTTHRPC